VNQEKLKEYTSHRIKLASAWTLIWAVMFVAQNTFFGWNRLPESPAEAWTDLLHIIPSMLGFIHWIKYWVVTTIAEVAS